jgi:hypothetical protein
MPAAPGALALCGEGGADASVEFEADVLPRFSHICQAPSFAAGCRWGAILMCPRGGELRTASSPGRALIAAAMASAAVPNTDCPGGSGVGCEAAATSVISACIPRERSLAVMLCLSKCDASSFTAVESISGKMAGGGAAMAASSSELASDGHAFFFFLGFSADVDWSGSARSTRVGDSSGWSWCVCDAGTLPWQRHLLPLDLCSSSSSYSLLFRPWYFQGVVRASRTDEKGLCLAAVVPIGRIGGGPTWSATYLCQGSFRIPN